MFAVLFEGGGVGLREKLDKDTRETYVSFSSAVLLLTSELLEDGEGEEVGLRGWDVPRSYKGKEILN